MDALKAVIRIFLNILRYAFGAKKGPPPFMPLKLLCRYTMNGRIRVRYRYVNGTYSDSIVYTKEWLSSYISKIRNKEAVHYGETDVWLYKAAEKYDIKARSVAILGSRRPMYESVCLFYGALPTTIDYNKIVSEDDRLKTMTISEYERNPVKFDMAFSVSSFEHDGLGRYGDPLNPDGDLLAMTKMSSVLRPGGILFLAVPVGMDTLVWNAHRIYGKIRLPLLLKGWEVLEAIGFTEGLFRRGDYLHPVHPIFVLKNKETGK